MFTISKTDPMKLLGKVIGLALALGIPIQKLFATRKAFKYEN